MLQKPLSDLRIGCVPYQLFFPYWTTITQGIHTRASELGVKLCIPVVDTDIA